MIQPGDVAFFVSDDKRSMVSGVWAGRRITGRKIPKTKGVGMREKT